MYELIFTKSGTTHHAVLDKNLDVVSEDDA
jgi:hypothetical protein